MGVPISIGEKEAVCKKVTRYSLDGDGLVL